MEKEYPIIIIKVMTAVDNAVTEMEFCFESK